jgi:hypothetical protein
MAQVTFKFNNYDDNEDGFGFGAVGTDITVTRRFDEAKEPPLATQFYAFRNFLRCQGIPDEHILEQIEEIGELLKEFYGI